MMNKSLAVLSMLGVFALATGCNGDKKVSDRYEEGFNAGYTKGYDEGYDDGDADGYERARAYFSTTDYTRGFTEGEAAGRATGYAEGYTTGKTDGIVIGRTEGYDTGYDDGYDDGYVAGDTSGYARGYDNGYDDGLDDGADPAAITAAYTNGYDDGKADGLDLGYDSGYDDGLGDGYDTGYDDGFDDGYDLGFDDGWDAGLGLSVGPLKTNSKNGRVNLLSQVHNDLINYKKIKAPEVTARGLEANGRLIFEETSMTSKDLEGRAAATEKYLVSQMGKQIQTRFGLSADRSVKVAKIANHWRKFSTTRAVTADDADAFSEQLVGANIKEIETALKASMKGDVAELNDLLNTAAAQNQTTPEKLSLMMNELFF